MKKILLPILVAAFFLPVVASFGQTPRQERQSRRAQRQQQFESELDTMIESGVFQFRPQNVTVLPAGQPHWLTNQNFGIEYRNGQRFDILLPYYEGEVPPYRMTLLNYTLARVDNYTVEKSHDGWTVTFGTSLYGAGDYVFQLEVFGKTGSATLTIDVPMNPKVEYDGLILEL